jgi:hypothetical protein
MMKIVAMVIGGLLAVLFAAFLALGVWMFGGEGRKERAAIRYAESAGPARYAKLYDDCRAIALGRPFSPAPYEHGDELFMWDEKSGYPKELQDFRPMRVYVSAETVTLVTYKCFDEAVEIDVSGFRNESPAIVLRHGDYQNTEKKLLWTKKRTPNLPVATQRP